MHQIRLSCGLWPCLRQVLSDFIVDNRGIVPRIEYGKVSQRMQTAQKNIGQVRSSSGPLQCRFQAALSCFAAHEQAESTPASKKGAMRSQEAYLNVVRLLADPRGVFGGSAAHP